MHSWREKVSSKRGSFSRINTPSPPWQAGNQAKATGDWNKALLTKPRHKEEPHAGRTAQGERKDAVRLCWDGVRKAKVCLEPSRARDKRGNKKGFCRYTGTGDKGAGASLPQGKTERAGAVQPGGAKACEGSGSY